MTKNTILIVDDHEFNRELLCDMFPERDIIEAANGAAAIEQYEQHKDEICAVLTDVMMPETDGFALLEYFSEHKYMNDVPVFVITADSSSKAIMQAYRQGAEDIIIKPLNPNFVKKHVDHIIELFELRRRLNAGSVEELDDPDFSEF